MSEWRDKKAASPNLKGGGGSRKGAVDDKFFERGTGGGEVDKWTGGGSGGEKGGWGSGGVTRNNWGVPMWGGGTPLYGPPRPDQGALYGPPRPQNPFAQPSFLGTRWGTSAPTAKDAPVLSTSGRFHPALSMPETLPEQWSGDVGTDGRFHPALSMHKGDLMAGNFSLGGLNDLRRLEGTDPYSPGKYSEPNNSFVGGGGRFTNLGGGFARDVETDDVYGDQKTKDAYWDWITDWKLKRLGDDAEQPTKWWTGGRRGGGGYGSSYGKGWSDPAHLNLASWNIT